MSSGALEGCEIVYQKRSRSAESNHLLLCQSSKQKLQSNNLPNKTNLFPSKFQHWKNYK